MLRSLSFRLMFCTTLTLVILQVCLFLCPWACALHKDITGVVVFFLLGAFRKEGEIVSMCRCPGLSCSSTLVRRLSNSGWGQCIWQCSSSACGCPQWASGWGFLMHFTLLFWGVGYVVYIFDIQLTVFGAYPSHVNWR